MLLCTAFPHTRPFQTVFDPETFQAEGARAVTWTEVKLSGHFGVQELRSETFGGSSLPTNLSEKQSHHVDFSTASDQHSARKGVRGPFQKTSRKPLHCIRQQRHFPLLKQQGPQPSYPPRGGGEEFIPFRTLFFLDPSRGVQLQHPRKFACLTPNFCFGPPTTPIARVR